MAIKASLNNGIISEDLKLAFKDIVPENRVKSSLPESINPYWFAGFTSGDASFSAEVQKSSSHKIGYQVQLKFRISQHNVDLDLLNYFIQFVGGGFVKECAVLSQFRVVKLSLITDRLIPLFNQDPIDVPQKKKGRFRRLM